MSYHITPNLKRYILYYVVLYDTILHCTMLHYVVMCSILFYSILFGSILLCYVFYVTSFYKAFTVSYVQLHLTQLIWHHDTPRSYHSELMLL